MSKILPEGVKFDKGKILPDLVLGDFMAALEQVVFCGTFGAIKYEPKNFQTLRDGERRYAEAAFRHYTKRKKGELFDPESGELHQAHELWCRTAELYFYLKEHEGDEYELTIRDATSGMYYGLLEWQHEPHWWPEHAGRQAIWYLMDEGTIGMRIDKRLVVTADADEFVEVDLAAPTFPTAADEKEFARSVTTEYPFPRPWVVQRLDARGFFDYIGPDIAASWVGLDDARRWPTEGDASRWLLKYPRAGSIAVVHKPVREIL